jgi:hypothetical protein
MPPCNESDGRERTRRRDRGEDGGGANLVQRLDHDRWRQSSAGGRAAQSLVGVMPLLNIGAGAQQVAQSGLLLNLGASPFLIGLDSFALNAPGARRTFSL